MISGQKETLLGSDFTNCFSRRRTTLQKCLFLSTAQGDWATSSKAFMNTTDFCINTAESEADHNVYDLWYGYHNIMMMGALSCCSNQSMGERASCPCLPLLPVEIPRVLDAKLIGVWYQINKLGSFKLLFIDIFLLTI